MATIDEILATMSETETATATDEMLVIDPNTRQINLPGTELVFGVVSDTHAERKYFLCPRFVGNNIDLSSCFVRVNYCNASGEIDGRVVDDVVVSDDNLTFSWELTRKVTQYKGQVKFLVLFCRPGGNGVANVEWHTTLATGVVLEGLDTNDSIVETETADLVAQLLAMVENQTTIVENVGATQVEAVKTEGATQVKAVRSASEAAEAAAVAEIEAKGKNTLDSIPADFTALSAVVDGLARTTAPGIVCEAEGSAVVVNDASDMAIQGLRIFGRSTQDGTPTPDAPVEIVSVENPVVTVATEWESPSGQNVELTHTLSGIPVASGGNYTDENGQQWICDEVDLARGVYVQRVGRFVLDGNAKWNAYNYETIYYGFHIGDLLDEYHSRSVGMCNQFETVGAGNGDCIWVGASNANIYAISKEWYDKGLDAWKEHLNTNPLEIVYARITPIETPLSDAEINAFKALHSNKPNTTVLNDAGAHMAVAYVADTKLYIDNKIAALTV